MPQPTVSTAALQSGRLRELSLPHRVTAAIRPTAPISGEGIAMAAGVAHDLDFMPLLPRRLPVGYHLSRVDLVPFCRTLAILVFRGPRSRQFQITEQLATISFETQFVPGRLPSTRVRLGAKSLTVFHGEFDGTEPIDGLHWHASRRVIAWDEGKVICQLQLRAGESPSVWQGLRMAASVTGLASQNSNQPHD